VRRSRNSWLQLSAWLSATGAPLKDAELVERVRAITAVLRLAQQKLPERPITGRGGEVLERRLSLPKVQARSVVIGPIFGGYLPLPSLVTDVRAAKTVIDVAPLQTDPTKMRETVRVLFTCFAGVRHFHPLVPLAADALPRVCNPDTMTKGVFVSRTQRLTPAPGPLTPRVPVAEYAGPVMRATHGRTSRQVPLRGLGVCRGSAHVGQKELALPGESKSKRGNGAAPAALLQDRPVVATRSVLSRGSD